MKRINRRTLQKAATNFYSLVGPPIEQAPHWIRFFTFVGETRTKDEVIDTHEGDGYEDVTWLWSDSAASRIEGLASVYYKAFYKAIEVKNYAAQ